MERGLVVAVAAAEVMKYCHWQQEAVGVKEEVGAEAKIQVEQGHPQRMEKWNLGEEVEVEVEVVEGAE